MYYLMIKTNLVTGLKYLCVTSQEPYSYLGSGKYWRSHCDYHGYLIRTEVLLATEDQELLSTEGIRLSRLWDVVESRDQDGNKIWANLIEERGYIYEPTEHNLLNQRSAIAQSWQDPERLLKQRQATAGDQHYSRQPGYVSKLLGTTRPGTGLSGDANPARRPEVRLKMSQNNPMNDPEHRAKISGDNHYTKQPGYQSRTAGLQHYTKQPDYEVQPTNRNYDHTLYTWHNTGTGETVTMTRRDFIQHSGAKASCVSQIISGRRQQTRGWRLQTE